MRVFSLLLIIVCFSLGSVSSIVHKKDGSIKTSVSAPPQTMNRQPRSILSLFFDGFRNIHDNLHHNEDKEEAEDEVEDKDVAELPIVIKSDCETNFVVVESVHYSEARIPCSNGLKLIENSVFTTLSLMFNADCTLSCHLTNDLLNIFTHFAEIFFTIFYLFQSVTRQCVTRNVTECHEEDHERCRDVVRDVCTVSQGRECSDKYDEQCETRYKYIYFCTPIIETHCMNT